MRLISHRGNLNGRSEGKENDPAYIDNAIKLGYDVEIDLWYHQQKFWLGHDEPMCKTDINWLIDRKHNLWVHCKDLITIDMLRYFQQKMLVDLNYFFHNTDDCTLTSKGYLWVFPGKQPVKDSIAVLPEKFNNDLSKCVGICSDHIVDYR